MNKLADLEKIIVDDSGYENTQSVIGWMHISVVGMFEELTIAVEEVASTRNHDTFMYFDLDRKGINSSCKKNKVLKFFGDSIEYQKDKKVYLIVDNDLVQDLFSKYGENAG